MSDSTKKSVLPQITIAVVVALAVGTSSPWWWDELFPDRPPPTSSEDAPEGRRQPDEPHEPEPPTERNSPVDPSPAEGTGAPRVIYDLVANAQTAEWTNWPQQDVVPWAGPVESPLGCVAWRNRVRLEDGTTPARVLLMKPPPVKDGRIMGAFILPEPIRKGDRLRAKVGFLEGKGGNAEFRVATGAPGVSAFSPAGVHDDGRDGVLRTIEADIGYAEGLNVVSIFRLRGEGSRWRFCGLGERRGHPLSSKRA